LHDKGSFGGFGKMIEECSMVGYQSTEHFPTQIVVCRPSHNKKCRICIFKFWWFRSNNDCIRVRLQLWGAKAYCWSNREVSQPTNRFSGVFNGPFAKYQLSDGSPLVSMVSIDENVKFSLNIRYCWKVWSMVFGE
jgi:hypothetical protein